MLVKNLILKSVAVGVVLLGVAQADVITLTPTETRTFNTWWQEIVGVTYDAGSDNIISEGETVSFTVTLDKNYRGAYTYDALKLWMNDEVIGEPNYSNAADKLDDTDYDFIWMHGENSNGNPWAVWNGGTKDFTFDYTFGDAGTYDLAAAVTCSHNLSGFWDVAHGSNNYDGDPSVRDWQAWEQIMDRTNLSQGQSKWYQLTVEPRDVPEPTLISLLGCGLLSLVFFRRKNS